METSAIATAAEPTSLTPRTPVNQMSNEDFFKLLVTELQQQDPFEPTKTSDMIGQVSQIRSIETSAQLITTLQALTGQQRTAGASELLGKFVEANVVGADGTRTPVSGVVTGVQFEKDGTAVLELDSGQSVRAADVTRVTINDLTQQGSGTGQSSGTGTAKTDATARLKNDETGGSGGWLAAWLHL